MGDESDDDKEMVILNRRLVWAVDGLEYRPDDKHVRKILEYFGLGETSKGQGVAIVKDSAEGAEEEVEFGGAGEDGVPRIGCQGELPLLGPHGRPVRHERDMP